MVEGLLISFTIISKDIICPICKENSLIAIKDYKININGCKNNHQNENILLNLFEETQKIRLNDIKCNICEVNNKSNTYKNEFYICITSIKICVHYVNQNMIIIKE